MVGRGFKAVFTSFVLGLLPCQSVQRGPPVLLLISAGQVEQITSPDAASGSSWKNLQYVRARAVFQERWWSFSLSDCLVFILWTFFSL